MKGWDILDKVQLTRKEWEDLKVYLEFKGKKKKPCTFCPMVSACLGVELTKNKCEGLKAWIKEGDELYSKVRHFIDNPNLAPLIKVILDRMQEEEYIKNLKKLLSLSETKMYRLMGSETSLFNERITFKE